MRRVLSLSAAAVLTLALALPGAVSAVSGNGAGAGQRISMAPIGFGPGYWLPGDHTYSIHWHYAPGCGCGPDDFAGPYHFTVLNDAPLYTGNVILPNQAGWDGSIWSVDARVTDNTINPAQGTFLWAGWWFDFSGASYTPPDTMQTAKAFVADSYIAFSWDGGDWVIAHQGPITSITMGGFGVPNVPATGFFHRRW